MTLRATGLGCDLGSFHLGPVTFEVARGKALAVIGPSGSGKTTLLRALAGFLPLRTGSVEFDGHDLSRLPPERRGLGYVPQGLGLVPHRTVEGNVRFPGEVQGRLDGPERAATLLKRFALTGIAHRSVRRLSGGEKQRVAMARALAADPKLLLWDEPLTALDVESRNDLLELLGDVVRSEGIPLVLVTHDPAAAGSIADELLVLHQGLARFRGTTGALLEAPVDRFTARFVGFENVYSRSEFHPIRATAFGRWLAEHSGPEGVAVPAGSVSIPPPGAVSGQLTVRRRSVSASGTELYGLAEGLPLRVRLPPGGEPAGPGDLIGRTVDFGVEERACRPIANRSSFVGEGNALSA